MIANMESNKKKNPIVIELFIRGRKHSMSLVFIRESYFTVTKNIRLNVTYYFIIKIANMRESQQKSLNRLS